MTDFDASLFSSASPGRAAARQPLIDRLLNLTFAGVIMAVQIGWLATLC